MIPLLNGTQASAHDSSKPLQVAHNPPLSSKDSELAEQSIRSDQLSLEKLLVHTIYMRTRSRLNELKQELQPRKYYCIPANFARLSWFG